LKYGWLFLNRLDSFAALEKLIAFYVREFNQVMPHSAFHGQTPDEMFFGRGNAVPDELAAARKQARAARLQANRALECEQCRARPTPQAPSQAVALAEEEAA
jgi:putative transposase